MDVKCQKCGSIYILPDHLLGEHVKVTMDDCPTCKMLDEAIAKINREIGVSTKQREGK